MIELARIYLEKAEENLAAAKSEFAHGRYNSCASRAYYSCFQAAIHALIRGASNHRDDHPSGGTISCKHSSMAS